MVDKEVLKQKFIGKEVINALLDRNWSIKEFPISVRSGIHRKRSFKRDKYTRIDIGLIHMEENRSP